MKNLIRLLFFLVMLPAAAQEAPTLRTVEFYVVDNSRIRNLRFGVFDEDGLLLRSSRVGFPTSGLSRRYTYTGPMPMVFFEEERLVAPDGTEQIRRRPMARVEVPEGQDEVMLLFMPNSQHPEQGITYEIQYIDIHAASLSPGHLSIYNTMPTTLLAAVGRHVQGEEPDVFQLLPGINTPQRVAPRASLTIAISTENDGVVQLYNNTFDCDSRQSLLFILFPPGFPGSIHLGGKLIQIPSRIEEDPATEVGEG